MAQVIADRRDVDFVLFEQYAAEELQKAPRWAEFNRKTIQMIVQEARRLAVKEMLPTRKEGDDAGCRFEKGQVTVPETFHRVFELLREGEWTALCEDVEWGGQGMPRLVSLAVSDYLNGANYALMMYAGLTHGAGKLVEAFGTDEQKELFLKKMYTCEWTGTMLLTEPAAGSDVGALTTTARRNEDGTYSITGNKIFISSGDHDMAENIIHPVLARIEGAPDGTKGISLFLVPKYWVNADGSLGELNDVVCTGIEHKMGIHGNATCSLTLGGNGNCRGLLLGEENKGMRAMFLMMNEARLLVGMQGFGCASSAYLEALDYARQRVQGKHLLQIMDPDAPSVPIINHPDVRRQLMLMKVYIEAMRSLLYYVGLCDDLATMAEEEEERLKWLGLVEVLTPIAKGYVTDRAFDVCNHGVQVFGGYGYIREYPMEQLMRDCRITMIYEGTNGIQAMDLLGRKLGLRQGKPIMDLFGEMQNIIAAAKKWDSLADMVAQFEKHTNKLAEVAMHLGGQAMGEQVLTAFAHAYPFMEVAGDMAMAWMLLWRATVATEKLAGKPAKKDIDFYEGQIKSAQFFIEAILPVTFGKMKSILQGSDAAVTISEAAFGAK